MKGGKMVVVRASGASAFPSEKEGHVVKYAAVLALCGRSSANNLATIK